MECALLSIGIAAIGIIIAIRAAMQSSARVDLLERRLRSLEILVRTPESQPIAPAPPPSADAMSPAPHEATARSDSETDEPDMRAILARVVSPDDAFVGSPDSVAATPIGDPPTLEPTPKAVPFPDASPSSSPSPRSPKVPPTPAPVGFERQVTTRIAIWLGAIALFLAGAFFVKYTFDAGLLGPQVRIILGAIFGLGLIGAGEWMRRRGDARIGEGLTAAGVADLYAVTLAALNLYHFIGQTTGFTILAAITAAAIALSLRQGPFVAMLALIGGFATPALIGSEDPRPGPLFVYLFLLQGGIAGLSRTRGWWPLGLLAFFAGIAWVGIWLLTPRGPIDGAWLASFVLLSLPLVLGTVAGPGVADPARARVLGLLASLVAMVALGAVVNVGGFTATDWGFLAILGAGAIAAARFDARHEPLPWLSLGLTSVLLIVWAMRTTNIDATIFPWVCLAMGVLYGVGGYAALWRSKMPARFAVLAVSGVLAAYLIGYAALAAPPAGVAWGLIAVGAALVLAAAATPLARPAARAQMGDAPLAALLAGATALVSLAVAAEFERRLIPVAWAIEVPLLALLYARLRVDLLRVLAGGLAGLAIVALVLPDIVTLPIGPIVIWNWLLYAYGVPMIALGLAAWIFHRLRDAQLVVPLQAAAALLAFLLVTTQTRHFFHRDALFAGPGSLPEVASYVSVWLLLALAAVPLARGATRVVADGVTRALAVLSLVVTGVGLLAVMNPLWHAAVLGDTLILNDLLWSYGIPATLFIVLAYAMRSLVPLEFAGVLGAAGVVLIVALASLEVRHVFDRDVILRTGPSLAETATYVSVWLILALIGVGVARGAALIIAEGATNLLAVASLAIAAGGLLLARNPLWNPIPVGETRIWNLVLACYGIPAALLLMLAVSIRRRNPPELAGALVLGSIVMLLAMVSLEVRQWFHGDLLTGPWATGAELYTYSAVWTVLGLILLGAGVVTHSAVARWASLVLMLGVVGKVFLVDMAGLRDLYRVFSLLGLGMSLMLLAFIYQRFVFRRTDPEPAT